MGPMWGPCCLVLGKGMTAGYVPASAVAVSEPLYREIHDAADLDPFPIGSTTDGHPLAMAAGMAVLDVMEEPCVPATMPFAASSVARQAPSGKPPPMPLAEVMMSGVMP